MPVAAPDFDFLRRLVYERSAIVLEPGKEYLVEARLIPLAKQAGFANLEAMLGTMRAQPANGLHQRVVEAMTTNETSWYRDAAPFDALRLKVLPELIARPESERQLRIWSMAASSGQEIYSIAMLLKEHFPALGGWRVHLLATDLSRDVLAKAREGRYNQLEVNRGLPAPLLIKYFEKNGLDWQLKAALRQTVEFREMNLATSWPALPPMDLIFLRNVLIYFDVETKRQILERVRRVLKPHGHLFLGGAETTFQIDDRFERVSIGKATAYRLRAGG